MLGPLLSTAMYIFLHHQVARENREVSAHRTPHYLHLQGWATQNPGNSEHHSLDRKGGIGHRVQGSGRQIRIREHKIMIINGMTVFTITLVGTKV